MIKHLPRGHEHNLKMPARPLPGHLPCSLAYAEKPHIQLPRTPTFTEGWLHSEGRNTMSSFRPNHTTDIANNDSNDNSSGLSSVYCVPGTEQAVSRHYL